MSVAATLWTEFRVAVGMCGKLVVVGLSQCVALASTTTLKIRLMRVVTALSKITDLNRAELNPRSLRHGQWSPRLVVLRAAWVRWGIAWRCLTNSLPRDRASIRDMAHSRESEDQPTTVADQASRSHN